MVHFSSFTGADSSKKIAQHIRFENVQLFDIDEKLTLSPRNGESYTVIAEDLQILIQAGTETTRIALNGLDCCPFSSASVCIRPADGKSSAVLQFPSRSEADRFVASLKMPKAPSAFEERTEETSATQYFQFYGYLSQQQNMMQDYIRTATYQRAILSNLTDFRDKVILDVGAGSGILSFFAAQAGAKKVYAVEASSMAEQCQMLVKANNCANKITVISGKIEEISLPEQVDTIISEPMGYMLLNERMLETFLHAKKFLKPKGKIFPTRGDLHVAPFCDEALFMEQCQKANFWSQEIFYGVNLTALKQPAIIEYFKQPVVDTFDVRICVAPTQIHKFNFDEISEDALHDVKIPLRFQLHQTGFIHGLAFWFDCAFIGSDQTIWLSTAPTEALTHWYQVRCLIATPLFGRQGEIVTGQVHMIANKRQSYDVEIRLECDGKLSANTLDLKNPYFRYTGQAIAAPPGSNTQSPAEQYWLNAAIQAVPQVGAEQMITNGVCMGTAGEPAMNILAAGNNMGNVGGVAAHRSSNAFVTASPQATATAVPFVSDYGMFASGGGH